MGGDVLRCPFCDGENLTPVVVDPSRFREERSNPYAYICSECNRIIYSDMLERW